MLKWCLFIFISFLATCFSAHNITWVAIGDSITYINDHVDETGNRINGGYMTMVKKQLPYVSYINQGHNGWTSGGIAENIDKLRLTKADVYSVFLGTNDWWQGRPIGTMNDYKSNNGNSTVFGSYRIIINKIRELNPAAKIILVTPMQRSDFVYINDKTNNAWGSYKEKNGQSLKQFAEAIKAIAMFEHVDIVDLYNNEQLTQQHMVKYKRMKDPATGVYRNFTYPAFTTIPFDPATDDYPYPADAINMTYDGLHPSDKGYAVITRLFVKIMKRYKVMAE